MIPQIPKTRWLVSVEQEHPPAGRGGFARLKESQAAVSASQ